MTGFYMNYNTRLKWVKLTSTKIFGGMSYTFVAADPIGPP